MSKSGSNRSRILVIGGTGSMGQHLTRASLAAGHPTAVLVRAGPGGGDPAGKAKVVEALKASGAEMVEGDLNDHESLVAAIEQADVVISAVGHHGAEELLSQLKIVEAINHVRVQHNNAIKRFLPSEYGCDVEQVGEEAVELARSVLLAKVRVRQAVRAAGIPHTLVCSYWGHGFMLPRLGNPEVEAPLAASATIFGDGETRAIFVDEKDMSALAVRAADDHRALDKILYVRPPGNTCSFRRLVELWEEKTGRALEKSYVGKEELLRRIREAPLPLNFQLAMVHATLAAKVCDQDTSAAGVEATDLYPDIHLRTVSDYLDDLVIQHQQQLLH